MKNKKRETRHYNSTAKRNGKYLLKKDSITKDVFIRMHINKQEKTKKIKIKRKRKARAKKPNITKQNETLKMKNEK